MKRRKTTLPTREQIALALIFYQQLWGCLAPPLGSADAVLKLIADLNEK